MKLSIIIVNYNVKYFLKQCLQSVLQAAGSLQYEIICVDNHSVDGSVEMIQNDFPSVKLIKNNTNYGFAKACNQGIKIASGEYILTLNPDTVLENDSLIKPLQFMDSNDDAGSLGVKMVNGNGKFLPESKRGLPTPAAAFYKMMGLSRLFYPSRIFGKYYLDYLNQDEIQSVHVLTGAYMLIRKSVLDKVGLFDEQFFMYGEDVDLSHRIIMAGFKNYYFPHTRIIHYKGESTKKESIKYVYTFYKAMIIFSKKHFSKKNSNALSIILKLAIISRAFIAIISRFLNLVLLPIIDFVVLGIGLITITKLWEANVTYTDGGSYPLIFYQIFIPAYIVIWLTTIYLSGGYDKSFKPLRIIQSMMIGTIFILIGYSLLDESLRFSRIIILMGSVWGLLSLILLRWIYQQLGFKQFNRENAKRIIMVGKPDEVVRIENLIIKNGTKPEFLKFVSPDAVPKEQIHYIGNVNSLLDLVKFHHVTEVIFCARDITYQQIINKLTYLQEVQITSKIALEDGYAIIGSNSISSTEDLYLQDIKVITSSENIRNKRLIDIIISLVLICMLPINLFLIPNFKGLLKNIVQVIFNQKTWVGFCPQPDESLKLPLIKKGILFISDGIKDFKASPDLIKAVNLNYAQKYHISKDLLTIYIGFKKLGR